MRKPLIAGNWKMNGSLSQVQKLLEDIKKGGKKIFSSIEVVVCPAYVHLTRAHEVLKGAAVSVGAQNVYFAEPGAFTGEVSASMLADLGCKYVIVGHSERRAIFRENFDTVSKKFQAVVKAGLTPILCVGETQDEREHHQTEQVVREQLDAVIHAVGLEDFSKAVIAYEPVWAIGTGLTATPDQAQAVHAFIRHHLVQNKVDLANTIRILYGGSMKAENAAALLAMPDIDGGLIGGASLDAKSFLAICQAANEEVITTKAS